MGNLKLAYRNGADDPGKAVKEVIRLGVRIARKFTALGEQAHERPRVVEAYAEPFHRGIS